MCTTAATAAIRDVFKNVDTEDDRLYCLNYCCGNVLFLTTRLDLSAKIRKISAGTEDADIALSTVKNHFFIQRYNANMTVPYPIGEAMI